MSKFRVMNCFFFYFVFFYWWKRASINPHRVKVYLQAQIYTNIYIHSLNLLKSAPKGFTVSFNLTNPRPINE